MIIKKYKSIVTSINNPVEGIYTLEFKSFSGAYKYTPGQFLHLALDSDYDGIGQWPESRCFSMQSNPDEDKTRITYAVKGRYTRMMEHQLKIGSEVWLKLPYGDLFTQSHNKVNTVFIAGGTGITPFLSLFANQSFYDYESPRLYLGFRSAELNIYQAELSHLCNSSVIVKYIYENLDGRLDIRQIFDENGIVPDYYISGPPEMIRRFRNHLMIAGISSTQIKTDDWE
jgi:ferredoxin-NADP reductase